jgi:hypothetical protein
LPHQNSFVIILVRLLGITNGYLTETYKTKFRQWNPTKFGHLQNKKKNPAINPRTILKSCIKHLIWLIQTITEKNAKKENRGCKENGETESKA